MSDGGLSIVSQEVVGTAGAIAGRYPGRGELRQRSVFAGRGDVDAAAAVASGSGRRCAARTAARTRIWGSISGIAAIRSCGSTSAAAAVGSSSAAAMRAAPLPAGTQLTLSAVGSEISLQRTGRADRGDRQQPDWRCSRDHDLRRRHGRQLGRRDGAARRPRIRWVVRCRGCRGRWCCRTTAATI